MKKLGYILGAFSLPLLAFAQIDATNVGVLSRSVIAFINNFLVPLIFALAFLVFIWGVFNYFIAGGHDEEKKDKGKSLMLYGLIGFFVMVSVWGLVNILTSSVNLQNTTGPARGLPDAPINN